jgi:dipeptidyl aminopeptidase/acylaminoacyl peptidase
LTAPDGVPLSGFLLAPEGQAGVRRPALLALHTHSYGQFYDHWAPFYQYLARAGYVVLQLDQRGSSGYGRAFRDLAIGAWGTSTGDDVAAAAAWLRGRPEVDPARVGVMGFSFGAYLTLMAMTKTPGTFQAGVAVMGVADRRPPFASRNAVFHIGRTPDDDPGLYERISPITSVAQLRDPLLVIHSDRDRNVPPEQTYRLQDALDREGAAAEVIMYPDEAHGLASPAHQLDSYRRIEQFLARALDPARRPPPAVPREAAPSAPAGENRRDRP